MVMKQRKPLTIFFKCQQSECSLFSDICTDMLKSRNRDSHSLCLHHKSRCKGFMMSFSVSVDLTI